MPDEVSPEALLSLLHPLISSDHHALLCKAYDFSKLQHEGQYRRSGEPFFHHPFRVACILAKEMRLDATSVIAALLHDLVEDTKVTLGAVQKEFGSDVASIVDGLTKLAHIHFRSTQEKQAENFRKMLLAMSKDLRVVMIKIADRVDNMRTIASLPENKRHRIAKETIEIYAPLAHRLGMGKIKADLEDLSFSQLNPEKYLKLKDGIAAIHVVHEEFIEDIRRDILRVCIEHNLKVECQGRVKHLYSVAQKMEKQNIDLTQVYDIVAFRIITKTVMECYEVLGVMHAHWRPVPGRFKDYIAMQKPNLYQSLHTIVIGPKRQLIEVQIRTTAMHEVAEYGIAAHWKYKEGGDFKTAQLEWVNRLLHQRSEAESPHEFISNIKADLFVGDIYVFTPNGDVLEFPEGATPLDFAYTIHTELGHHTTGAIVNGKVVSLRTHLQSGDQVEIISSPKARPSKDWLKFVQTARARQKVRAYLRAEERLMSAKIGQQLLETAFRKRGRSLAKEMEKPEFVDHIHHYGLKDSQELFIEVGYGKLSPSEILTSYYKTEEEGEPRVPKPYVPRRPGKGIEVSGIHDVLIRFAKCCSPIPGDDIVGFVTRGHGVTVHTTDCHKVADFDAKRMVEVRWHDGKEALHSAIIKVLSEDAPGLLYEMSKVITDLGINISKAQVTTTEDRRASNIFHVQVHDLQELNKIIHRMEKVKGVYSVSRS